MVDLFLNVSTQENQISLSHLIGAVDTMGDAVARRIDSIPFTAYKYREKSHDRETSIMSNLSPVMVTAINLGTMRCTRIRILY